MQTAAPTSTSQNILTPIAADLVALNSTIQQSLHSEVALINQISDYIIEAGGKRLRPALLILLARALGVPEAKMPQAHTLAAVIEFIHTATLLHDDVVDESELRRGRKTANAAFGNAASVLVGDFLYSRAFQMMVGLQNMKIMAVLANATNTIAEGEVLQLLNLGCSGVNESSYFQVIEYKTAKLFEAAARLACILADADISTENQFATYGKQLGTAFQLIDDVLDYTGDSQALGKNIGDDLREGKPTLPLIHALQNAPHDISIKIRQAIENGGTQNISEVLEHIQSCKSLQYTEQKAKEFSQQAQNIALTLAPSNFRNSLINLCTLAVTRNS
jgi:octaprenyl-diphosphate synthase